MQTSSVLSLIACLLLSGCATLDTCSSGQHRDLEVTHKQCVFAPRERPAVTEQDFRKAVGEPDWPNLPANRLGVALSGGGSKSAAFAMGVLAGLDDLDYFNPRNDKENKPRVSLVSSVSGGSYAAYYLFAQAIANTQLGARRQQPERTRFDFLFADGLTASTESDGFSSGLLRNLRQTQAMDEYGIGNPLLNGQSTGLMNRWQSVVRCTQDVLVPGKCDAAPTSIDQFRAWGSNLGMLVPTILLLPIHHLGNSLFDFGVNVAPSRIIYLEGIGLTYGTTPLPTYQPPAPPNNLQSARLPCPGENDSELETETDAQRLARGAVVGDSASPTIINCRKKANGQLLATPLSFKTLAEAWQSGRNDVNTAIPFWVIQATSTKYRSLGGWLTPLEPDAFIDSFEFTPLSFGSRRYGFVPGHQGELNVLDAVTASAAFFDANQQVYHKPYQSFFLGSGQHLFNLNWGQDIPNYNVSETRRSIHRILPLPIGWLDSVLANIGNSDAEHDRRRSSFIRLIDGGSSENTASVSALRRGIKTLIISDAAEDKNGVFEDLCSLREQLASLTPSTGDHFAGMIPGAHDRLYLHIPGLENFADHCSDLKHSYYELSSRATDSQIPAFLACLTHNPSADEECTLDKGAITRIIIAKPMLNISKVHSEWGGAGDNRQLKRCVLGRYLYTETAQEDCTTSESDICRTTIPCEVGRLMANYKPEDQGKHFPQTGTTATTGNSSATLYAAYRELARQQIVGSREAIVSAASDGQRFDALIKEQKRAASPRRTDR